jgi:hypothetical protein
MTTLTPLSRHVLKTSDYDTVYRFHERVCIHIDSHATEADAERMAYREVFGKEVPEDL